MIVIYAIGTFLLGLVLVALIVTVIELVNAPEGVEDSEGFHRTGAK